MNPGKSVAIIGAGIGGITTSIFLAKKGYKVSVYEKNDFIGGRCGQTIHEGHRFDIGATIYFLPSVYREVFESLELDIDRCFDFVPLKTLYRLFFEDGSQLDFAKNKKEMEAQLEAREKGSYKRMIKYVDTGYRFLKIGLVNLLDRNFYHPFQFINLMNVIQVLRIKAHLKHSAYIRRYFSHPHLRMAFTFQNIYVGQSPYNSSALFSMLPAAEITEGSVFPKGGMNRIAEKLVEIAREHGVDFKLGKEVEEIETEGKRAKGLRFKDGEYRDADLIVANADLPHVYADLLPQKRKARKIKRLTHTCSAMVFHWGLDKDYSQLSQHNVFLVDDYKGALNAIFKKKTLTEQLCFYVHAPSRSDKTAAPEGGDSLSIVIPVPHLDKAVEPSWGEIKKTAKKTVLERLKKQGLDDIEDHITYEKIYMPETWESVINVSKGATFGSLSHRIFQMGYFRPHNRHARFKNLYFAGGSTHPGNGIPLVLLSARLTAQRIMHDEEK
jgi:phytoene desaturase